MYLFCFTCLTPARAQTLASDIISREGVNFNYAITTDLYTGKFPLKQTPEEANRPKIHWFSELRIYTMTAINDTMLEMINDEFGREIGYYGYIVLTLDLITKCRNHLTTLQLRDTDIELIHLIMS
jgi:hypothetical protein